MSLVATSGGTESILMAVKTYRDWARVTKGITNPEMSVFARIPGFVPELTGWPCFTQDSAVFCARSFLESFSVLWNQAACNPYRGAQPKGEREMDEPGNVRIESSPSATTIATHSESKQLKHDHDRRIGAQLSRRHGGM